MTSTPASKAPRAPEQIETPEPLAGFLARHDMTVTTWQHDPVFTVEEGRHIKQAIPGGHSKNLFLKDKKGALCLVVASEATTIDLKSLHKRVDSGRFSFASAAIMEEVLGVTPGSVTPFALINDSDKQIKVVLDAALLDHEQVNFHPLKNDKTTTIQSQDLVKFVKLLGYEPLIIDFTAE